MQGWQNPMESLAHCRPYLVEFDESDEKVVTVDPYFEVIFFTGHSQSAKIGTFGHF